jgi:hypothetical protein
MTGIALAIATLATLAIAGGAGMVMGRKLSIASRAAVAGASAQLALPRARSGPAEAINLVNRYVTMARGRAVRVEDSEVTIVYSRPNRTKGRVKFDMDTAFDEVREGDVGVLVIVEQDEFGQRPFYKFIRDADTPNIDDVLEIGTGDDLTDDIYRALRESKK